MQTYGKSAGMIHLQMSIGQKPILVFRTFILKSLLQLGKVTVLFEPITPADMHS